jgi:hypothetical protein
MSNPIDEEPVPKIRHLIFDLNNCKTKFGKILKLAIGLFVLWSGITFLVCIAFGKTLLWGAIALVLAVPLNVLVHLFIKIRTLKPYRWFRFLIYLAFLYLMIIISGVFSEKDSMTWVIETSQIVSILLAIIYSEYFVVDWILTKVFSISGTKTEFRF